MPFAIVLRCLDRYRHIDGVARHNAALIFHYRFLLCHRFLCDVDAESISLGVCYVASSIWSWLVVRLVLCIAGSCVPRESVS